MTFFYHSVIFLLPCGNKFAYYEAGDFIYYRIILSVVFISCNFNYLCVGLDLIAACGMSKIH